MHLVSETSTLTLTKYAGLSGLRKQKLQTIRYTNARQLFSHHQLSPYRSCFEFATLDISDVGIPEKGFP
jgi:hypothetical protein